MHLVSNYTLIKVHQATKKQKWRNSSMIKDNSIFDYVVVGGGPSGMFLPMR